MDESVYLPYLRKASEKCWDEEITDCVDFFAAGGIPKDQIDGCKLKKCNQIGNKSCQGKASFNGNGFLCDCNPT